MRIDALTNAEAVTRARSIAALVVRSSIDAELEPGDQGAKSHSSGMAVRFVDP